MMYPTDREKELASRIGFTAGIMRDDYIAVLISECEKIVRHDFADLEYMLEKVGMLERSIASIKEKLNELEDIRDPSGESRYIARFERALCKQEDSYKE